MSHISLIVATAAATLTFATAANAQGAPPAYGEPISLELAKKAAAAAEAEMKKNNWNMVITVMGSGGQVVYLQKADLAANGSVQVSQDKAITSVNFRAPTKAFMDRLSQGGENAYLVRLTGSTPIGGGIPIVVGGKLIGAIGVSGGSAAQDHQVAQAGVDALK
jgi:uncharacterized protein GlcG (DUF336 family)